MKVIAVSVLFLLFTFQAQCMPEVQMSFYKQEICELCSIIQTTPTLAFDIVGLALTWTVFTKTWMFYEEFTQ